MIEAGKVRVTFLDHKKVRLSMLPISLISFAVEGISSLILPLGCACVRVRVALDGTVSTAKLPRFRESDSSIHEPTILGGRIPTGSR